MKKFKYISVGLILILCIGVLCVGAYAITVFTHSLEGSLVIDSINQPISMSIYVDSTDSQPITTYNEIRSSKEIKFKELFGDNGFKFNVNGASGVQDVQPKKLIIRITNLSTETQIGAYFLNQPLSATSLIKTSDTVYYSNNNSLPHSYVDLPSYTIINDKNQTGKTQDLTIQFNMATWQSGEANFKYYLYIEDYAIDAETTYESTTHSTIVTPTSDAQSVGTLSSVESLANSSVLTNTVLTQADTQNINFEACPNVVVPEGVETISQSTFTDKIDITSIILPSSLTTIEDGTSTTGAFKGCTSLSYVALSKNLTNIGAYAFYNCSAIAHITIPENVNSIGAYSLYNLTNLTEITIPENVSTLGAYSFNNCTALTEINYNAVNPSIGAGFAGIFNGAGNSGNELVINIGQNVESISKMIFNNLTKVTAVNFLGNSKCKSIGESAFTGCSNLTRITIPESVTSIGGGAFQHLTALTEINYNAVNAVIPSVNSNSNVFYDAGKNGDGVTVNIGNNVKSIPDYLFYNSAYAKITTINFTEDSVCESIGTYAFGLCNKLNSIIMPDSLISIGDNAFRGCTGLTSTTIPDGLISIGNNAFRGCTGLTSITIPSNVTSIGSYAFYDCTALTVINYYAKNLGTALAYNSHVFYKSGTDGQGITVNIGENVNSIPDYLFYVNSSSHEPKVTAVNFADGCVCTSIGDGAFRNVTSLTSITIPNSITSIGTEAFYGCENLATVYNNSSLNITPGSTTHGYVAYYISSILKTEGNVVYSITTTEKIALRPISQDVTTITIAEDCTSIADNAFKDCTSLSGKLVIPESVTSIGNNAFTGCRLLTSLTLSSGLTSIGTDAFKDCYYLVEVFNFSSLPLSKGSIDYGYVGHYALILRTEEYQTAVRYTVDLGVGYQLILCGFGDMTVVGVTKQDVTNVNISSGTSINKYAFYGFTNLTSIIIDSDITSIGEKAFSGCINLTSVNIPDGVTSIGFSAFEGCSSLESITLPFTGNGSGQTHFGYIFGAETYSQHSSKVPSSLTTVVLTNVQTIADRSFYSCSKITSVTLPSIVSSIGTLAFFCCYALTNVNLPSTLTTLNSQAFSYCYALTSIAIPKSVTSINVNAFTYCRGLTSITVESGNTVYSSPSGSNAIIQGTQLVLGCKSTTIPSTVTSIGNSAFVGCTGLTGFTLPKGVISFSASAFQGCSGLQGLTVESGNTVYRSQSNAIIQGTQLVLGCKSTTIPNGVTSIGAQAFSGCTGLTGITIPNSVTSMGNSAFNGCTGLAGITIPNSVTSIGNSAFNGCTKLASITIPNSVTSIGNSAFNGCTKLTSVTLSQQLSAIGSSTFFGCTSLTSITIPASVTSIGTQAFYNCSKLTTITMLATTPPTLQNLNAIPSKLQKLYIPAGTKTVYSAATNWKNLERFMEEK